MSVSRGSQPTDSAEVFWVSIGPRSRASSRLRVFNWIDRFAPGDQVPVLVAHPTFGSNSARPLQLAAAALRRAWSTQLMWVVAWVRSRHHRALYLQEALPPGWFLRSIKRRSQILHFDFSDVPGPSAQLLAGRWPRRFLRTLGMASSVTYESEHYASVVPACSSLLRGPVDVHRFAPSEEGRQNLRRVVWTGGPGTVGYLRAAAPGIRKAAEQVEFELVVIGADPKCDFGCRTTVESWAEHTEPELLSSCDIGLFPLDMVPASSLRGGGKLFLYMASGLAVIASRIGIAPNVVDPEFGLLFSDDDELADSLVQLLRLPPVALGAMQQKARQVAVNEYSYEAYESLLRSALEGTT